MAGAIMVRFEMLEHGIEHPNELTFTLEAREPWESLSPRLDPLRRAGVHITLTGMDAVREVPFDIDHHHGFRWILPPARGASYHVRLLFPIR